MQADPIRGRFIGVSSDCLVMPALAGMSILIATHHPADLFATHSSMLAGVDAGFFMRWCFFGIASDFAFSFSLLHRCRARSRSMLLLSLLSSCALTTYMIAFYLVRSHRAVSYITALTAFFVLAFVYQALRYKFHFAQLVRHRETVLVLGTGREAQKIWKHIRIDCDRLVTFKGFVSESSKQSAAPDILARTVCAIDSLEEYLHDIAVDTLVLTATGPDHRAFVDTAKRIARECGCRLLCSDASYQPLLWMRWLHVAGDHYVEIDQPSASIRASRALKAMVDRVLAGAALLWMAPALLPLLLLYQLVLGEFPLVSQYAYGYHRRQFRMWDLRVTASATIPTRSFSDMRTGRIAAVQAKLLSRVGHFLKISGLARAPRLWNVFIGDMSLVGPRPVSVSRASLGGTVGLLRRYTMRPGLCWPKPQAAQTEDEATFSYLEQWSPALDGETFALWLKSRASRTMYALSAPLLSENPTLTEPTQRTR